jgi:hypothetical protein
MKRDEAGVTMALGKRKREQQGLWIASGDLPKSPGHPFYQRLNKLLVEADFDRWVERLCKPYLRRKAGPAIDSAWRLLPHDFGRLLRRDRLAAWYPVEVQRECLVGRVSAYVVAPSCHGSTLESPVGSRCRPGSYLCPSCLTFVLSKTHTHHVKDANSTGR